MRSILKNKKAESEGLGVGYIIGMVIVAAIIIIMVLFWTGKLDLKTIFDNMLPKADGDTNKYDEIDYADEEIEGGKGIFSEWIIVNESKYFDEINFALISDKPYYVVKDKDISLRPYISGSGVWESSWGDIYLKKEGKIILIVAKRTILNGAWWDVSVGVIVPTGDIYFLGKDSFFSNVGWGNKDNLFSIKNSQNGSMPKLEMAYCGEKLEKCGVAYKDYLLLSRVKFNVKTNMVVQDFKKLYDSL